MDVTGLVALVVLRLVAGSLTGVLGMGGGLVLVPGLAWLGVPMVDAAAAGLLHSLVGGLTAGHVHRRALPTGFSWALPVGTAAAVAAGGAGILASVASDRTLQLAFVSVAAIALVVTVRPTVGVFPAELSSPTRSSASFLGVLTGGLGGLVGLGGGVLVMPFALGVLRLSTRVAILLSVVIGVATATSGLVGRWVTGGLTLWPAAMAVVGSTLGSTFGAKLHPRLPNRFVYVATVTVLLGVIGRTVFALV